MVVMDSEDRNNKSLCEKSVKMVSNIVKLSSFSIAKISLGAAGPSSATKTRQSMTTSDVVVNKPQSFRSQKSEKPKSSSQPISFVMEPNGRNESQYVVHEEKSPIDGMASAYIRKVHQKNLSDLSDSNLPPLPPPPSVVM